jgi:hypothetical protein
MKQQDIDKKIGMPDVDKEWVRFEHEVIDQKTTSRKSLYWGIGIAASIALVAGIFLLNHDAEKQQTIAQQTTNTTEIPTASDNKSAIVAAEEPVALPAKDEPVRMETEQRPRAELLAQAPPPSAEAKVYDCGEIMPQFPGGDRALMEFIKSNIRYPDLAMEYGARGRVITTFTVDSLGYTSNYKVTKIMKLKYDTLRLSQESAKRQQQLKEQIEQQYKEKKDATMGRFNAIIEKLQKEPDGSYGNLMVYWKEGGGHSMFYRIEDNKVVLYDAQSNKKYNLNTIARHANMTIPGHCYLRTDNLTPDYEYLKKKNLIG